MLTKIIAGNCRKTRLHDEKGNLISLERFLLHAPLSFSTAVLRLSVGYRPELPWIPYTAIPILEKFLSKKSRVLEFGAGMSTIWYAKHAGEVYSIEDNKFWYEKLKTILQKKQLTNVNLQFADNEIDYPSFMAKDSTGFDLIMVDGAYRSKCVLHSAKLLKSGGILYLDDSDKHSSEEGGDTRLAEQAALSFAKDKKATVTYITDLAPTQLFAQQGMIVKIPE